jgi:tellurite resistance protein TehA-like permease
MLDLSVGSGILAAVVFIVFIGLVIFTIILWKDAVDTTGEPFSIITFTALTAAVGVFLAAILGFIDLHGLIN